MSFYVPKVPIGAYFSPSPQPNFMAAFISQATDPMATLLNKAKFIKIQNDLLTLNDDRPDWKNMKDMADAWAR